MTDLSAIRGILTEHGLQMDIGAFVSALQYATGKEATIFGRPLTDFFKAA